MPPPFQDLDPRADPPDFGRLLLRFPFERKVTAVHVHHTGRPRQGDWRGRETLETMWFTHTHQLGWSDIAQHLTIAPDGGAWTGRDWNRPPCSFPGRNGTRAEGPFMISVVGDFDDGRDACAGRQWDQLVEVIARVQALFDLGPAALLFHRDLDGRAETTCPGGSVEREALARAVSARRRALHAVRRSRPPASTGAQPFGEEAEAWYQFITTCNQHRRRLEDEPPDVPRAGDTV